MEPWQEFVVKYGDGAFAHHVAHVLGRTEKEIRTLRQRGVCEPQPWALTFPELFSLWHGRAPAEADWPPPARIGGAGYEWQAPELALLASLVGRLGTRDIAQALTQRLRTLTGDAKAQRSVAGVQARLQIIGMQAGDLVGGITVPAAAKEVGSLATVHNAIDKGELSAQRVAHRLVIPREAWEARKAKRTFPPPGYVKLASLRQPLGIRSDAKLPEFATRGYVPTAIKCFPYGMGSGTAYGTWFVDPAVARKLVADRRAGRPMPWHGQPMRDNLKATWRRLQERRHPPECETCAAIWGAEGFPATFDEYERRYPPLAHGAKRHLTRVFSPGLTFLEVAEQANRKKSDVLRAVRNGTLRATEFRGNSYVSRTNATRWVARGCPIGESEASWMSIESASKAYRFTARELAALVRSGQLRSRVGTAGAQRGITYVLRQQCAEIRAAQGFTEAEAAARLGITVARLQRLLRGVEWRPAPLIPLVTVQAVQKRLESREGFDLAAAAAEVGKPLQWVKERIADGTVRVARAPWDRRRKYLSQPMLQRLQAAVDAPVSALPPPPRNALTLDRAALDAGVSTTTLRRWIDAGEVERIETSRGWMYLRSSLRARAARYWRTARYRRPIAPRWLGGS